MRNNALPIEKRRSSSGGQRPKEGGSEKNPQLLRPCDGYNSDRISITDRFELELLLGVQLLKRYNQKDGVDPQCDDDVEENVAAGVEVKIDENNQNSSNVPPRSRKRRLNVRK